MPWGQLCGPQGLTDRTQLVAVPHSTPQGYTLGVTAPALARLLCVVLCVTMLPPHTMPSLQLQGGFARVRSCLMVWMC